MKVKGKFKKDSNFVTIFSENTIYTVARNTGDWGSVSVGNGSLLTQELYDKWCAECENEGTFNLRDD